MIVKKYSFDFASFACPFPWLGEQIRIKEKKEFFYPSNKKKVLLLLLFLGGFK